MALRALLLAGLVLTLPMGGAWADSVSEKPDAISVAAYRDPGSWWDDDFWDDFDRGLDEDDGLVLVTEVRTIDVPAGRAKISFRGVAEGIVPQTAAIEGLPAAMLERNQDYDLLSPGSLIARSVGRRVRLVRTSRINGEVTEETATVRSGPRGVVLDYGEGRVEALKCSGWPERLVFEEIPEGLADKPTLSVVTHAAEAGRYQVRLSYLAFGLKWSADYVARIHPDGRTLDLTGWITLANRSDTTFANAPTQVVAGEVRRNDDTQPPAIVIQARSNDCWPQDTTTKRDGPWFAASAAAAAAPGDDVQALIVTAQKRVDAPPPQMARESDLADYKLYDLPEPTTVAARQTKQVMMLDQRDVRFERLYAYWLGHPDDEEQTAPTTALRLENKAASGLGRALPGGKVMVMEPYGGALILAGESRIGDTPVGLPADIHLGRAMDIRTAAREVRNSVVKRQGEDWTRREFEVQLANDKPAAVTLELSLFVDEDIQLVSASRSHGRRYDMLTWTIRLQPGERQLFSYVVDER